jgi:hypothetical protein
MSQERFTPGPGSWEAVQPMFQPLLGDEDTDNCNPWTKDELTVAFIAVGFIAVSVLDFFGLIKVFQ